MKAEIRICVEDRVESTNKLLKEKVAQGEGEGLVVIAHEQTAGRGRRDHTFYSPSNTGLYMSILIRPEFKAEDSIFVLPMTAVAVAEAIEEITQGEGADGGICVKEKRAEIKWVNDIYIDDKKVCGILVEGVYAAGDSGGKGPALIVGIGINVFEPQGGFPEDIRDRAAAVFDMEKDGLKERLLTAVVNKFFEHYEDFQPERIIDEYRRRSCVVGRQVNVFGGEKEFVAMAKYIDERGRLVVEDECGKEHVLENDDISIRTI